MTSNEVDAVLTDSVGEVGAKLLTLAEDQWFDRKSILVKPKDLAKPLTAFANAEGGTLAIGLSDGKIQGISRYAKNVNELRQVPMGFTSPPVRAKFSEVPCINSAGEEDYLLLVRVEPGERVHETVDGECYLRIGDESRRLNYTQRQELEYDRGQTQYDGFAAKGVGLDRVGSEVLQEYAQIIGTTPRKALEARSLLTLGGEVTNAAYLLFGQHPQDLFPQAYVRVLRYLGVERGTGSRLELEENSDRSFEGPIPEVITRAQAAIEELIPKRRALADSGRFNPSPIVPRDAWLEGLVNAVIHRSYSLAGDHIRVEIYSNRIEIESPGRFSALGNLNDPLKISRFARNPRIARVCADLRIGQELGEGIRRIFEEMRRVGLTDPVYRQTPSSVKLVLAAIPRIDPKVAARLPHGSQAVVDLLRSAGPLGTGDIADSLMMSRPAALRRLRALEGEGIVHWVGKTQKDPRALWVLEDF